MAVDLGHDARIARSIILGFDPRKSAESAFPVYCSLPNSPTILAHAQKCIGLRAVSDAVVEGEAQIAHGPDDDGVVCAGQQGTASRCARPAV